jgi:hypothetical protein
VDSRREIGPGGVEWLDLGPAEPGDRARGPQRRGRRPWYLLAAAIAVAVILVVALNHDTKHKTASSPSSLPPASATDPTAPSTAPPPPSASPSPAVAVTNLGRRLLDVPAGWELLARGPDSVVRIELAKGRVTRTAAPELVNSGGISFVVGPDRVIAQTSDEQGGYLVPDGRPARDLPPALLSHGPVLPGPDPSHVWVETGSGTSSAMALVGFDGRRAGPSIRVPEGAAQSDGAGYVLFYATGGVYDARPGGAKRITTGALLAIGPTRWLTEECDDEFRCVTAVTDRSTGARRTLAASTGNYSFGGYSNGLISPDGSVAALVRDDGQEGRLMLSLFDLSTGAYRVTDIALNTDQAFSGGGVLAWSPDSRWLFIVADVGRLLVLDSRSMRASELSGSLPFISQLGFRS